MKITIPPAALEAGAKVLADYGITAATDEDLARDVFEAMVGAWPGMDVMPFGDGQPRIRLPLSENPDAEA